MTLPNGVSILSTLSCLLVCNGGKGKGDCFLGPERSRLCPLPLGPKASQLRLTQLVKVEPLKYNIPQGPTFHDHERPLALLGPANQQKDPAMKGPLSGSSVDLWAVFGPPQIGQNRVSRTPKSIGVVLSSLEYSRKGATQTSKLASLAPSCAPDQGQEVHTRHLPHGLVWPVLQPRMGLGMQANWIRC